MWKSILFGPWIGLIFFFVGIPGLLDDVISWRIWINLMGPVWSGVFIGIGATLIFVWVVNCLPKYAKGVRNRILSALGLKNIVFSEKVENIKVMSRTEYNALEVPEPNSVYLLYEESKSNNQS